MSFRTLHFIIGLTALLTGSFALAWFMTSTHRPPELSEYVRNLPERFRGLDIPFVTETWQRERFFNRPWELVSPAAVLPQPDMLPRYRAALTALESCSPLPSMTDQKEAQARKIAAQWRLRCQGIPPAASVWREPPWIHPLGGSWLWHLSREKGFAAPTAKDREDYLHLTEQRPDLKLAAVESLLKTRPIFLNGDRVHVLLLSMAGAATYAQVEARDFYRILRAEPYIFQSLARGTGDCLLEYETGCWRHQAIWWSRPAVWRASFIASLALLFLALIGAYLKSRRQMRHLSALHTVSALAINHELRHPVTALSLRLDQLRGQFNRLSEEGQDSLLDMGEELLRLKKLMKASESFFRLKPDHSINWNIQTIPNLQEFLRAIAESYKVGFTSAGEEPVELDTDPYWFSVAVENLIKNALKYGHPPVSVSLSREGDEIRIEVTDHGKGLDRNPFVRSFFARKTDTGLGVGLYMSRIIVESLRGKLSYASGPTRFTITVKTPDR